MITSNNNNNMKKIAFIFCVCLFALTIQAQTTSHMKFMGIELNGTISAFQSKLLAKGLKVSPMSKNSPDGMRVFEGSFSGEKANISVWYNTRTKIVYRAKAIISREGEESIKQLKSSFESKLDIKYGTDNKKVNMVKDDYLHEFDQCSYLLDNGEVDLFISSTGYTSLGTFFLQIDYHDLENTVNNRADEMDDL